MVNEAQTSRGFHELSTSFARKINQKNLQNMSFGKKEKIHESNYKEADINRTECKNTSVKSPELEC